MITSLLLAASLAHGQELSTTSLSIPIDTQIEISNIAKDVRRLRNGRNRYAQPQTFAGGICFSDGTCQVSVTTVAVSTQSYVTLAGPTSLANTASLATCFAGSTVTVTLETTRNCMVTFSGSAHFTGNSTAYKLGFLVNGGQPTGYSDTNGFTGMYNTSAASQPEDQSASVPVQLSPGTNSICLTGSSSASSTLLIGTSIAGAENVPRFGVTCWP